MRTIKRFLTLSLIAALAMQVWGERVSQEDAAAVANNFMNVSTSTSGARMAVAPKRMVLKTATAAQEENQYYVYENADGEGWVMVAANDIARPILAYSDEGHFRFDNQPSNVKGWLRGYNRQIRQAEQDSVQATEEVKQEWRQLRKGTGIRKGTPVVAALIQTKWDQDAPYWNQCPTIGSERCLTGCVATAMAQVMNYWQWPVTGTGSASVTVNGQNYSVDFSTGNYDWNNMLNKYSSYYEEGSSYSSSAPAGTTAQKNAVAKLMYHCGVAAEMDYGTDVSGAYTIYPNKSYTSTRCAQYALIHNFGYNSSTIKGYSRPGGYGYSSVNDATWHNYLKTELDAARPIMYAGADNEGGHSFICDGYDNTTPTRKYHFNWGWSGYCDGYYDVDALVPGTGGSGAGNGSYNDDQDIIIGIMPPQVGHNINLNGTGCSLSADKIRVENGNSVTVSITPTDATYDYTSTTVQLGSATISSSNYTLSANKQTLTINGSAITGDASNALTITVVWTKNRYKYEMLGEHCTMPDDGMLNKNAALNLTITPDAGYTLADAACWDVSMGGSALTYGTGFTYNPGTGAFSIASVTGDVEILAYGGHTVTWSVQGINSTTTFADGAALVLPDNPSDCSGVGGKKFVGWTANSSVDGSAPADLFTAAGTKTVTANTTYYAVYATASGSGGSSSDSRTFTVSSVASANSWSNGVAYTPVVIDPVSIEGNGGGNNAKYYTSDNSWRMYNGGSVRISVSGGSVTSVTSTPSQTFTISEGVATLSCSATIKFTNIVVNYTVSGGTSYSDYSLTCTAPEPCSNQVNVSKGTPSNGDFSIDKTGPLDNCSVGGLVVTVSGITPAEGYEFGEITQMGIASGVTIDQVGKTVTYAKDVKGASTINVTFTEKPTYEIKFYNMGAQVGVTQNLYVGATATLPPAQTACEGYTFLGWWNAALAEDNTDTHTWITDDFTVSEAANQNYYAVYSHTEGGGAPTPATLEASYSSHDGWTISGTGGSSYWILKEGASITSPVIADLSTVTSITFTARTYGGGSYNTVNVTTSGSANVGSATASSTSMVNKTISVSGLTGSGSIVFSSSTTSSSNGPGINNIVINYSTGGGGTTYYTTAPNCVECTNKVTLSKGTPEHGSFSLDKADGEYNNCSVGGLVVTVSGITPADGYQFKEITQTGIASGVTIDQAGKTVTYAKDVAGSSTINVVFELIPSYTVTWSSNGDDSNTATYHEGEDIVFPPSADGCDDKTFMGWVSDAIPTPQEEEPTYVTSATMPAHDVTYYAVFADEDGDGEAYKLVTSLTNGKEYIFVNRNTEGNGYALSATFSSNLNTGTAVTIATSGSDKVVSGTPGNAIIWVAATGWSLKNKSTDTYLKITGAVFELNASGSTNLTFNNTNYGLNGESGSGSTQYYVQCNEGIFSKSSTTGSTTNRVWAYEKSGATSYSGYTTSCVVPTEVTVTFNANGGEGTMAAQVMDYNTATALTANAFTRTGYSFQGWATSSSGAVVHTDEASVSLKKNTTLYAVWQKNSYTITLNELAHGTIETSPAGTAEFEAEVTITVTPNSGYVFGSITVTNNTTSATIATSGTGATQTFTMPASNVTITATVTEIPTYKVTWSSNGDGSNQVSYYEGDPIVFPGTATGCDGKVFRGWSATTVTETDIEPTYVTSATMPAHNVTYYAVYAEASGSGGAPSTETYGFEDADDDTNWTIDADITKSSSAKATGTYGGIINTDETYIYFNNKVKVTNFSFKLARTSKNSNYYVKIETSTDGSVWTEAETYLMSSFANGSFTPKSKDFDGSTELYVRLYCYNTTAVRYIDDISITYGGGTTYTGYTTTCGAGISAQNIGWITTSVSQKVKRVINVSAKNFEDDVTLAATCANSHFAVTLGATDVPAGPSGLTTTLTVEYTPTAQGREENVEIELTAGDKSRTITVSGRCVPDEFLLITKKSSTWYALPANMATSGEHDGIEVSPNDATTPTVVPVSPSNAIYSLASVANSRYADNGNCVRLVGNDNLCLWSNMAEGATKVNIQNKTSVATAATDNHDWLLSTTDGVHYTIANPHHPHYGDGRILAFGTKFGMYIEDTEFFIVSAGCSSQPGEVTVSPHRVEATFSWVSNASSMTIDLYTNELMTEGHLTATASSSPYIFTGLEESKPYWYKLTPGTDIDCAVTGSFITTGPIVDIVEWQENGVVLYIDKGDITPLIVIDGQEEHGSISGGGGNATELFFAKYFEGAGSMKLVSVFNGTNNDINLSDYSIFVRMRGGSGSWSPGSDVTLDLGTLGSIKAGQEIIFFSRPLGTETDLADCSDDFLTGKVNPSKAYCTSAESNPRWVECGSTLSPYSRINFNGNDPILLLKNTDIIDIIGSQGTAPTATNCNSEKAWAGRVRNMDYGKTVDDPSFAAFYEASSKKPFDTATDDQKKAVLNGFGINLDDEEINITTARCIFFRDKRVLNGDSAVLMNETTGTTFVTFTNHDAFTSEWYGRSVCMTDEMETAAGASGDAQATCNSYQDIANMDYNEYYIDWTNIDPGTALTEFTHDPNTNEYTIPIDNMRQHACLNLRFQLVHEGNVLTEATQQVPIVVVGNNVDTNDPLFSELVIDKVDPSDPSTWVPSYSHSLARCKDCDVVVLGSAKLTKGSDSDPKDVAEVGNIKVYPGGQLIVPSETHYTMKSLALRRQEDAVASADVQGTITFSAPAPAPARKDVGEKPIRKTPTGTKKTYFDLRVDPTNWHYISLPYDCDVADIRYANPEETDVPVLGTDYLIKWYNGEKRAATQAGGCWEMVAADATLKAGLGYIFSIPGEGSVRREFRFPMDNEVIAQEKADKMVNGVFSYGGDQDMNTVRANHRGWNLLGDPYLLPYTSDIEDPVMTGYIVPDYPTDPEEIWDGHYKFADDARSDLRYIVEPVDNGRSEYRQVAITNYPMKPFTSYFVQIGGSDPEAEQGVQFNLSKVDRSASPVRRAPAEYEEVEDRHPVWCAVTLTNPKGEKDETTLLISDNFTDGYDMMDDLTKWRGTYYQYAQITTKPVLASRNNEGEMAFNALPDSSALAGVPLNYFAASQGFYTFAYDDKYDRDLEVKEVKLWDKTTNQWYDLMNEPYSFSTARTDNKDRFVLSVRVERKHNQTTTDLENAGTYRGDKPRKLLINGLLYIQRGKDVYDVTGKQLLNR